MMNKTNLIPDTLQQETRLKFPQVSELSGLGRTKIYELIKQGAFPAPERRGKRCSRWRAGDVIEFLNAGRAA
jgi:prophage regulatory protein